MGTTDEPEKILAVLNNILETSEPNDGNEIQYLLGEINGLSQTLELKILKKLHDEGVLIFLRYKRSNGIPYSIEDNFQTPIRRNAFGDSMRGLPLDSVTKPVSATLLFKKKKLEKRKVSIQVREHNDGKGRALKKDTSGDFLFKGKLLMIGNKPLSHDDLHYKVLDTLYENGDQNGKVSLNIMQKELLKRDENVANQDFKKLKKAVDNAILNLFRRTKIGSGKLKKILPDGKRLVDTYKEGGHSAGWVLNNPIF